VINSVVIDMALKLCVSKSSKRKVLWKVYWMALWKVQILWGYKFHNLIILDLPGFNFRNVTFFGVSRTRQIKLQGPTRPWVLSFQACYYLHI